MTALVPGIAQDGRAPTPAGRGRARLGAVLAAARRRPVLTVFAVALAARVVVAVGVAILADGALVIDDGSYSRLAAARAADPGVRFDAYTEEIWRLASAFLVPLAALYALVGPVVLAGQLFVAALGAAAAALVAWVAREALGAGEALAAGLAVALLPSQVLWSSLTLKDAFVWAALAALAALVALANRSAGWRLLPLAVGAGALLLALAFLRRHSLVVAAWSLALAAWAGHPPGRLARGAGAVALGVCVPWAVGLGPAGVGFVAGAGSLEERRLTESVGETALFEAYLPRPGDTAPATPPGPAAPVTSAPSAPVPPDRPAPGRRAADREELDGGLAADLAHLPRGLTVVLLEPLPWRDDPNPRLRLARAEAVLWYPLLALGLVGAVAARRSLRAFAFPLLAGAGVVAAYALAEGNLGTAYRHRGEAVWAVALLAALGAHRLWGLRHHRGPTR